MNTFYFNNLTEQVVANKPKLNSVYYQEIVTDKTFDSLVKLIHENS